MLACIYTMFLWCLLQLFFFFKSKSSGPLPKGCWSLTLIKRQFQHSCPQIIDSPLLPSNGNASSFNQVPPDGLGWAIKKTLMWQGIRLLFSSPHLLLMNQWISAWSCSVFKPHPLSVWKWTAAPATAIQERFIDTACYWPLTETKYSNKGSEATGSQPLVSWGAVNDVNGRKGAKIWINCIFL